LPSVSDLLGDPLGLLSPSTPTTDPENLEAVPVNLEGTVVQVPADAVGGLPTPMSESEDEADYEPAESDADETAELPGSIGADTPALFVTHKPVTNPLGGSMMMLHTASSPDAQSVRRAVGMLQAGLVPPGFASATDPATQETYHYQVGTAVRYWSSSDEWFNVLLSHCSQQPLDAASAPGAALVAFQKHLGDPRGFIAASSSQLGQLASLSLGSVLAGLLLLVVLVDVVARWIAAVSASKSRVRECQQQYHENVCDQPRPALLEFCRALLKCVEVTPAQILLPSGALRWLTESVVEALAVIPWFVWLLLAAFLCYWGLSGQRGLGDPLLGTRGRSGLRLAPWQWCMVPCLLAGLVALLPAATPVTDLPAHPRLSIQMMPSNATPMHDDPMYVVASLRRVGPGFSLPLLLDTGASQVVLRVAEAKQGQLVGAVSPFRKRRQPLEFRVGKSGLTFTASLEVDAFVQLPGFPEPRLFRDVPVSAELAVAMVLGRNAMKQLRAYAIPHLGVFRSEELGIDTPLLTEEEAQRGNAASAMHHLVPLPPPVAPAPRLPALPKLADGERLFVHLFANSTALADAMSAQGVASVCLPVDSRKRVAEPAYRTWLNTLAASGLVAYLHIDVPSTTLDASLLKNHTGPGTRTLKEPRGACKDSAEVLDNHCLDAAVDLCKAVAAAGGCWSLAGPRRCYQWVFDNVKELGAWPGVRKVMYDSCAWDLESNSSGSTELGGALQWCRLPRTLLTNHPNLGVLGRQCGHGSADHAPQGSKPKLGHVYTSALCRCWAQLHHKAVCSTAQAEPEASYGVPACLADTSGAAPAPTSASSTLPSCGVARHSCNVSPCSAEAQGRPPQQDCEAEADAKAQAEPEASYGLSRLADTSGAAQTAPPASSTFPGCGVARHSCHVSPCSADAWGGPPQRDCEAEVDAALREHPLTAYVDDLSPEDRKPDDLLTAASVICGCSQEDIQQLLYMSRGADDYEDFAALPGFLEELPSYDFDDPSSLDAYTHECEAARIEGQISNSSVREQWHDTFKSHAKCWFLPGAPLIPIPRSVVEFEVKTTGKPIRVPPARASPEEREQIERFVAKGLATGTLKPGHGSWASRLVCVRQQRGTTADGTPKYKWRICGDYRGVNDQTITDVYPVPSLLRILEALGQARLFSRLDQVRAYNKVCVRPEDCEKLAVICHRGLFEPTTAPFGPTNLPSYFSRLMDSLFAPYLWQFVCNYLDDSIIFTNCGADHKEGEECGACEEKHLEHLRAYLAKACTANLQFGLDKCEFFVNSTALLGFEVSERGTRPHPAKVKAIFDWSTPASDKDVERFVGFAGFYSCFVPNFADRVAPLRECIRADRHTTAFSDRWGPKQDAAFADLKTHFSDPALCLTRPRFDLPFLVTPDASEIGLGATLSQVHEDGVERPVYYASRVLTAAERKWSPTELEALGCIWACERLRPYIFGRPFVLRTDHRNLEFWRKATPERGRLARWGLRLEEFRPFLIEHIPGRLNVTSDALSRSYASKKSLFLLSAASQGDDAVIDVGALGTELDSTPVFDSLYGDFVGHLSTHSTGPLAAWSDSVFVLAGEAPQVSSPPSQTLLQSPGDQCPLSPSPISFADLGESVENATKARTAPALMEINCSDGGAVADLAFMQEPLLPWLDRVRAGQREDAEYKDIVRHLESNGTWPPDDKKRREALAAKPFALEDGLLHLVDHNVLRMVVPSMTWETPSGAPTTLKRFLLSTFHSSGLLGHPGRNRTYDLLASRYYWEKLRSDTEQWVRDCALCARCKALVHTTAGLLGMRLISTPCEVLGIDLVGPWPTTRRGNNFILTVLDFFTHWVWFIPIRGKSAIAVAEQLLKVVISTITCPRAWLSDRGKEFLNATMSALNGLLQIQGQYSTAYSPQVNAPTERVHRYVNAVLRIFVASRAQQQWDELMPFAELSYRCTPLMGTTVTPHHLLYGRGPRLPVDVLFASEPPRPATRNEWAEQQALVLREVYNDFTALLKDRKLKQKLYYDLHHHPVWYHADERTGDRVMLWRPARTDGVASKLGHGFHGTFRVIERKGLTTYVIRNLGDPNDTREVSVRHLRLARFSEDSAEECASEGRMIEFRDTSLPSEDPRAWVQGVVTEVLSHSQVRVRIVAPTVGLPPGQGSHPVLPEPVAEFIPGRPCNVPGCTRPAVGSGFCCPACSPSRGAHHDATCSGPADSTSADAPAAPRPRARWPASVLARPAALMVLQTGEHVLLDLRAVDHRWLLRESEQMQRDEEAKSRVRILSLELGDYILFVTPGQRAGDEQLFVGRVDAVDTEAARVGVAVHDSRKSSTPVQARIFEPLFVDLVSGERVCSSRVGGRPNFEPVMARLSAKELRAGPFLLTADGTLPPEIHEEWA